MSRVLQFRIFLQMPITFENNGTTNNTGYKEHLQVATPIVTARALQRHFLQSKNGVAIMETNTSRGGLGVSVHCDNVHTSRHLYEPPVDRIPLGS